MDYLFPDDETNEEEETYQQKDPFYGGRDGVIFLIDASDRMFIKHEDDSPFHLSIKCAQSMLANHAVSCTKDLVGIIFFATDDSKNPYDFKNVYVFQDLEQSNADRIKEIEELFNCDGSTFKYGHSAKFSLSEALWTCSAMFSSSKIKFQKKTVLIFTNNDDPHEGNVQLKQQAKTKAADLFENEINIDVMHLHDPVNGFEMSKFYRDIISLPDDESYGEMPDASSKIEELLTRVRKRYYQKRSLAQINLCLGGDVNVAVRVYNMIHSLNKPYPVKLHKATNEAVKVMSKVYTKDTGEILNPAHLKKYQEYAGKRIYMESDEVNQIKSLCSPGLLLLGFKPLSLLRGHHHIKPAKFIVPDEKAISGSTTLFSALLMKCAERKVFPLCRYTPRRNAPPRFVALLFQEEEMDEQKNQITPPGFHMVDLPFAEDIRKLQIDTIEKPAEDIIDTAKDIIKKLLFKYQPEVFENPVLQCHWRNIEALALDRDAPDEMTDYTMPNYDRIKDRAGKLIDTFKSLVFPDGYATGQTQRKKPGPKESGSAYKRAKMDDIKIDVDIKQEAEAGRLGKLTLPILKSFCKQRGIRAGTKKPDIIAAINKHFNL